MFFRRPKPRSFNFTPRYYDPEKEEAEERKKALNAMQSGGQGEHLRAEIKRRWKVERKTVNKTEQNLKIFFYIFFAAFAIYLIFFTDLITKFVSFFLR
jgi:hypothetical protein